MGVAQAAGALANALADLFYVALQVAQLTQRPAHFNAFLVPTVCCTAFVAIAPPWRAHGLGGFRGLRHVPAPLSGQCPPGRLRLRRRGAGRGARGAHGGGAAAHVDGQAAELPDAQRGMRAPGLRCRARHHLSDAPPGLLRAVGAACGTAMVGRAWRDHHSLPPRAPALAGPRHGDGAQPPRRAGRADHAGRRAPDDQGAAQGRGCGAAARPGSARGAGCLVAVLRP